MSDRPTTVLLVDDSEAIRTVTARILRKRGYAVTEASGAEAGFAALESGEIDALLTDVAMPEMDGPTMAAAMRARSARLGVVFMSGRNVCAEVLREIPGALFVAKPFAAQALCDAIDRSIAAAPHDAASGVHARSVDRIEALTTDDEGHTGSRRHSG